MWYVVQTLAGDESRVCSLMNLMLDCNWYTKCFVPMYEDVWRKGGIGNIDVKPIFPGYLFVDTDHPEKVVRVLRQISELSNLLSVKNKEKQTVYLPLSQNEQEFWEELLQDGIVRVTYIKRTVHGKITELIGPLESLEHLIKKVDVPHRRAIVEIPFQGEFKTMKFGLWTDADPRNEYIEKEREKKRRQKTDACHIADNLFPDIQVGDYVINTTGIYGLTPLRIKKLQEKQRNIVVELELFGRMTDISMSVDDIQKI